MMNVRTCRKNFPTAPSAFLKFGGINFPAVSKIEIKIFPISPNILRKNDDAIRFASLQTSPMKSVNAFHVFMPDCDIPSNELCRPLAA